jgi:hypothetical protein
MAGSLRFIGRTLLLGTILVLALSAVGLGWVIWEYQHLSTDVGHARTRLPRVISSALAAGGVTRDSTNVILVRGYGGLAAGSTLLFRSDPAHHEFSFLTIPAKLSHLPPSSSAAIDGPAIVRLTKWLRVAGGIPVNHVALLNFDDIGAIVDALGGITVSNRNTFDVLAGGSHAVEFPAGSLRLNGSQTVAFLSVKADTKAHHALRERNEAEVLRGVIDTAVRTENVSHLLTTAKTIADNSATDLTTSDVLGLVAVRLRATRIIDCSLSNVKAFDRAEARSAIRVFTATSNASPVCLSRPATPVPSAAILSAGATVLSEYGISALIVALVVVMGAMMAAAVIALLPARRVVRAGAYGAMKASDAIVLSPVRRVARLCATSVAAGGTLIDRIGARREMRRQRRKYHLTHPQRMRDGFLDRIDAMRQHRRRHHRTRLQRLQDSFLGPFDHPRKTGSRPPRNGRGWLTGSSGRAQHRVSPVSTGTTDSASANSAADSASAPARPPDADRPNKPGGPTTQPGIARASKTPSESVDIVLAWPQPVPAAERLSDRADLVVQLRQEGLSYREIADRLAGELSYPVSAEAVRQLWSQATGTKS